MNLTTSVNGKGGSSYHERVSSHCTSFSISKRPKPEE
jgi:hypothetical protein